MVDDDSKPTTRGSTDDGLRSERLNIDTQFARMLLEAESAPMTGEANLLARAERRLALASLLALERTDTDLRLKLERTRSDQLVTSRQDFMAMVSHDLRALLNGIVLSSDLISDLAATKAPIDQVVRYTETIQRFCGQMEHLVGDLMDAASIEAGKLSVIRELSSPGALVRELVEAFQPAAGARQLTLTSDIAAKLPVILFDPSRILQVITNLVGNALKFTPKGGAIKIRVDELEHDIRFAVIDTGEGIPADALSQVFERFFQTHNHDRRGLGLGLFIVSSIIDLHGGRVWAESTVGTGSTFSFTLPK